MRMMMYRSGIRLHLDDVPAPARKPAFMNVVNQSMGQFMPNGGGGDGGFL